MRDMLEEAIAVIVAKDPDNPVIGKLRDQASACDRAITLMDNLTPAEKRIVSGVCKGFSNAEMAKLFEISVRTVENHRGSAYRKVGAYTPAEFGVIAYLAGMIGDGR